MNDDIVFLFDLDGTVTKEETLPIIASNFNISQDIKDLTIQTLQGNIPFIESFIKRVDLLKNIPVSEISSLLENIKLNEGIIDFIRLHTSQCFIVTGNLQEWVEKLINKIGVQYFSSLGLIENNRLIKLTKIIKKEEIVKKFQNEGKKVVFIGEGNNDCEAMRFADISIACGIVHYPANSVLSIADYVVFDELAMLRLLNQINGIKKDKSIILSCAGIGSRLGIGQTKALINLNGIKLIEIQLKLFEKFEDIRIVVGYQSNEIIKTVLQVRKNIVFVYNHDYFHTKTAASYYLGAKHANNYCIAWDGDLLVHPDDIPKCLDFEGEFVCASEIISEEPIFVEVDKELRLVTGFDNNKGQYEWSGPACLKSINVKNEIDNVYNQIEKFLPLPLIIIRAMDIDTYNDYLKGIKFIESWGKHFDK